jgi:hypothetical protein
MVLVRGNRWGNGARKYRYLEIIAGRLVGG